MKNEYKTKARGLILDYLKNNADKRFTAGEIFEYIKIATGILIKYF